MIQGVRGAHQQVGLDIPRKEHPFVFLRRQADCEEAFKGARTMYTRFRVLSKMLHKCGFADGVGLVGSKDHFIMCTIRVGKNVCFWVPGGVKG